MRNYYGTEESVNGEGSMNAITMSFHYVILSREQGEKEALATEAESERPMNHRGSTPSRTNQIAVKPQKWILPLHSFLASIYFLSNSASLPFTHRLIPPK